MKFNELQSSHLGSGLLALLHHGYNKSRWAGDMIEVVCDEDMQFYEQCCAYEDVTKEFVQTEMYDVYMDLGYPKSSKIAGIQLSESVK